MLKKIINSLLLVSFVLFGLKFYGQHTSSNLYNLMPWPKEFKADSNEVRIDENFTISLNKKEPRVYNVATKFIRRLVNRTGVFVEKGFPLINSSNATVKVTFDNVGDLSLVMDESYKLKVGKKQVEVIAKTDLGVIRGLETLLQLVDSNVDSFYFKGAFIKDEPRFGWRGLMIDVARHYQPLSVIKRNLDAMASVKMNVFHWHLSDDQGFRVESKKYPKLHQVASDNQYYTHNEIKEVVSYAHDLGIRVVPEIDVPGHATAILTAYPEFGSKDNYDYKIERFAGVFHPTLNPINDEVYTFLDNLFAELTPLFPDSYFHIGGDENEGKHWDENHEIQKFKKKEGLTSNHDLQTYFNVRLEKILKKYGKKLMGWDEIMTDHMPKTAVIHSWRGKHEGIEKGTMYEAVKKGYNAVLSKGYYIDRMKSVDHHYLSDPAGEEKLTKEENDRMLGGEVTMWSELVTPLTIDSRIWPRTAAIAERFWSEKEVRDLKSMRRRLRYVNAQLEELGITHIRNKNVILRNIARHNDIGSLNILTDIFEPLKMYERNKGGTEYKSYSPFTLFADACSADAIDAYGFNELVGEYLVKPNEGVKKQLIVYFEKWKQGYVDFLKLPSNPNLKELNKHYEGLSKLSRICLDILDGAKMTSKKEKEIKSLIAYLKQPMVDTELVILSSLENLVKMHTKKKNKA
ncbi:glycoside hydrolase, family GH20 precursor. Beta-N-acetylhexosaminidase (chitobiase) [Tenacibaculum sp. 190524A02b]|uniref:beta-N-acetylhexosaminidase n=1 Tax=Tenacibaculum vairaonense TaxID=3137860 RepID=UPI0032B14BAB